MASTQSQVVKKRGNSNPTVLDHTEWLEVTIGLNPRHNEFNGPYTLNKFGALAVVEAVAYRDYLTLWFTHK